MPAQSGRNIFIAIGATRVAGGRAKTLTINNSTVDVTNDDSLGWRTLLAVSGVRAVDFEVEGVLDTGAVIAAIMADELSTCTATITGIGVFTGSFKIASDALAGAHDGETTQSASFNSSGAITFTPA